MNILFVSMSLELGSNDLYCDLIESLLNRKHKITVVRSLPNIKSTTFREQENGLQVLDVKTGNPFSKNLIKKGLNQILIGTYLKQAIRKYLSKEKYDLILYATPPVTLANLVKYCKSKYHAKTFLMLKDIFPQNAVDLEMMKTTSAIYKYFRNQEKKYYKYSDYIGCMSQANLEYVLKHNPEIDKKKVHIFPNSIKINFDGKTEFNNKKTVFIIGGNLGKPQNITLLINLSRKLKDYPKAEFIIVGDGTEQEKILKYVANEKPQNFIYIKRLPQKEYEKILQTADVGLISLDPRFTIPNVPSRMQVYMKLKKPIFAITDVTTDVQKMVIENDCGWWCNASELNEAQKIVKIICENKEEQKIKGLNGFEFLKREYDVESNVDIIEEFYIKSQSNAGGFYDGFKTYDNKRN